MTDDEQAADYAEANGLRPELVAKRIVVEFEADQGLPQGADMRKLTSIGIALAVVLVADGIGASALLASSDDRPKVSVVWHETNGGATE
ncbi:MAG: hypothetical protein OXI33_15820 [Chloroflexota bacterium]|nr:hypothetical protein [Chloroflexota bacterium]